MSNITRSRKGCWTCRSRRVKCDELRPICGRCAKGNVACGYGVRLTWHEESLSKGVCHGRCRSQSSDEQVRSTLYDDDSRSKGHVTASGGQHTLFLNTTTRDLEIHFEYENSQQDDHPDRSDAETGSQRPRHKPLQNGQTDGHTPQNQSQRPRNKSLQKIRTDRQPILGVPMNLPGIGPAAFRTLDHDSSLLSYYESVICSSSTLLDDADNNPYRHLILPLALQSQALYHAILAVSAETLHISDPKFRVAALEHGQRALGGLSKALQRTDWSGSDVDEILALALTLCWYEITNASRPSWVLHLNGIRGLIKRCQQLATSANLQNKPLYRFFTRYFAFHLVLARTAFRVDDQIQFSDLGVPNHEPSSLSQIGDSHDSEHLPGERAMSPGLEELRHAVSFAKSTDFLSLNMSLDDLDQIDPYMGFSNSLLLLINEVADLAWQDPPAGITDETSSRLHTKVRRLKDTLENLQQTPPQLNSLDSGIDDANHGQNALFNFTIDEFMAIAEANRLGALLLLHEVCNSRSMADTMSGNQNDDARFHSNLPRLGEEERSEYIQGILELIAKHLKRIIRTAALPLWPLFLAGCCTRSEEDRIKVMKIFEELEALKRYGNITPAREVVELVWRQRDLNVQDDRKRRKAAAAMQRSNDDDTNYTDPASSSSLTGRFEWDRAMTMLGGWKLSLT